MKLILLCTLSLLCTPAWAANVAVLYFQNQGNPQLEPLKVGLAQMLVSDLVGKPGITVVERQQLQAILEELKLGHSGVVDQGTAAKVGKLLGADHVVMGGYFEIQGQFRLDARVVDTERGVVVHGKGYNGTSAQFLDLEQRLAADLAAWFAPPTESALPRTVPPPEPRAQGGTRAGDPVQAALAFSEGLIFLDQKEPARAREAFEKAIATDSALDDAKAALARLGS